MRPHRAQRVSQLAAECTPDPSGGTAPPVAGLRDNSAPPLGGKLSRSLRSLRPIATASAVTGPRRFPEGTWTHPVPTTDQPHTHRRGGPTTPRTRHPRGLDHTQDPAPRRAVEPPPRPRPPRARTR